MKCHYCNRDAVLVTGREVYPHLPDLRRKKYWSCPPCNAYVGCHPGTNKPMGTLADAPTRAARSDAHRAFDTLWKSQGISRSHAYRLLAEELSLSPEACHIGQFDIAKCNKTVLATKKILKSLKINNLQA